MGEGHRQSTILYESVYVCRSSGYPNHEDVKEQRPINGAEFEKKIESQNGTEMVVIVHHPLPGHLPLIHDFIFLKGFHKSPPAAIIS